MQWMQRINQSYCSLKNKCCSCRCMMEFALYQSVPRWQHVPVGVGARFTSTTHGPVLYSRYQPHCSVLYNPETVQLSNRYSSRIPPTPWTRSSLPQGAINCIAPCLALPCTGNHSILNAENCWGLRLRLSRRSSSSVVEERKVEDIYFEERGTHCDWPRNVTPTSPINKIISVQ